MFLKGSSSYIFMVRADRGGTIFFFGKFHRVGISLYDQPDRLGIGITCHNLIAKKKIKGVKKALKVKTMKFAYNYYYFEQ